MAGDPRRSPELYAHRELSDCQVSPHNATDKMTPLATLEKKAVASSPRIVYLLQTEN